MFNDEVADADYALKEGDKNGYVRRAQRRLIDLAISSAPPTARTAKTPPTPCAPSSKCSIDNGVEGVAANGEADETTLHYLYSELLGFEISTPTMYNDQNPLSLKPGNLYAQAAVLIDAGSGEVLLTKTPPSACTPPAPPRS